MKFISKFCYGLTAALIASASLADEAKDNAYKALQALLPSSSTIDSFAETKAPNVYEAVLSGQIYHIYAVGDHILVGEAFNIVTRTSLKEAKVEELALKVVESTSLDSMIRFAAADHKRYVTVFTDIDCVYCRRFHREVPKLTEAGVEVRYMAFPRAGIPSSSYDKAVNVWCSEDQQQAMTDAKNGIDIESENCTNPVAVQYDAAVSAGISGTPMIVLDNGTLISGYLPYEQLLGRLGIEVN